MAKREIGEIIGYLKMLLKGRGISVERIVLFGSYAKGNNTEESDLDLVIISPDFEGKNIFERAKALSGVEWELTTKYLCPLDIVMMTPEEWETGDSLIVEFAKEGRVY